MRTTSRVEMVVTFLALLELVRLKQLRVEQAGGVREVTIFPAGNERAANRPGGLNPSLAGTEPCFMVASL